MKIFQYQWLFVLLGLIPFQGRATTHFVNASNPSPGSPYQTWATAATNIQDAVDIAGSGDVVLVTNGTYASGGWPFSGADVTNRVLLTNAVTVQSVNGPSVTIIEGHQVAGTSSSTNAVRCALLGSGAVLSGFTLTGGEAGTGNFVNGGGVSASYGSSGIVSNCLITGNLCAGSGGGASGNTLIDCVLTRNVGLGGGAAGSARMANCMVTNNSAGWAGGLLGCQATNCVIAFNSATNYGAGSGFSVLINCTMAANSLDPASGGNGGGSYHDYLANCIVYNNSAPNGSNYSGSTMVFCCAAPLAGGSGNILNAPGFVDFANRNFRLQSNSPCINAGNSAYGLALTDLDGNSRVKGGTVDIGAYEYQSPASIISYAWLQQYGLPTDGSADNVDSDHDGLNNWQEWHTGTDPTNPASVLKMASTVTTNNPPGMVVSWQSVSGINYFVQSGTSLATQAAFSTIQSNIVGLAGTTSYLDPTATNGGPYFYRVGVP